MEQFLKDQIKITLSGTKELTYKIKLYNNPFVLRWLQELKNITLNATKISINNLKFAIKNSLLLDPLLRKELRLKSKLGNSALKISGGQLQRINLARALYRKPKILILDEPTSALDKKTQEDFTNIIKNLKAQMTIIIVSHSESLLTHCDRVYYLSDGILLKK